MKKWSDRSLDPRGLHSVENPGIQGIAQRKTKERYRQQNKKNTLITKSNPKNNRIDRRNPRSQGPKSYQYHTIPSSSHQSFPKFYPRYDRIILCNRRSTCIDNVVIVNPKYCNPSLRRYPANRIYPNSTEPITTKVSFFFSFSFSQIFSLANKG